MCAGLTPGPLTCPQTEARRLFFTLGLLFQLKWMVCSFPTHLSAFACAVPIAWSTLPCGFLPHVPAGLHSDGPGPSGRCVMMCSHVHCTGGILASRGTSIRPRKNAGEVD